MTSKFFKAIIIILLSLSAYADDSDAIKQGLLSSMSSELHLLLLELLVERVILKFSLV